MTTAVHTEKSIKRFRCQSGVPAVSNLDLDISEGGLFVLVGPDGAGKTTTSSMLVTVMFPASGQGYDRPGSSQPRSLAGSREQAEETISCCPVPKRHVRRGERAGVHFDDHSFPG